MQLLIEDFEILQKYFENQEYRRGDIFLTEEPGVYEHLLKNGHEVISMSSLLSKKELKENSSFSVALTKAWIKTMNNYLLEAHHLNIEIDTIVNRQVYNLVGTAFYRFGQLKKMSEKGSDLTIPHFELDEPNDILFSNRNNNLLVQLATLSEFKNKFHPLLLDNAKKKIKRSYKILGGKKIKYWKYYILAICSEHSILVYSLHLPLIKKVKNLFLKRDKLHIFISINTPLIMAQLFHLFLKGVKISFLAENKIPLDVYSSRKSNIELKRLLIKKKKSEEVNLDLPKYNNLIDFLADKLSNYINSYVIPVTQHLSQKIESNIDKQSIDERVVIFTGSRNPNHVSAISNRVYANKGVPTIAFGEGPYCMLKLYRAHAYLGYMLEGDAFVSQDPHEEYYFKKTTKKYLRPFYIIGANRILKGRFPKLSRIMGRKLWGIPRKNVALLYLPTRYLGKSVRPYYENLDINYWNFQKRFVLNVLSRSGKDSYIKIFKKGLSSTPEQKMNPLNMINLPSNVTIKESPDFRFMRFSADLLIVDLATSTMSWALTSNVPVVYLNLEQCPLEDDVYEDMKKTLFLIDIKDNNDWESKLLELLQRPICEINKEWQNMSEKRDKFVRYYLTGYERGKTDFYNWIKYISDLGVDSLRKRNKQL